MCSKTPRRSDPSLTGCRQQVMAHSRATLRCPAELPALNRQKDGTMRVVQNTSMLGSAGHCTSHLSLTAQTAVKALNRRWLCILVRFKLEELGRSWVVGLVDAASSCWAAIYPAVLPGFQRPAVSVIRAHQARATQRWDASDSRPAIHRQHDLIKKRPPGAALSCERGCIKLITANAIEHIQYNNTIQHCAL